MQTLTDQNYIVTGAAQGIGAALAKRLAAMGATVIMMDKQVKGLKKVYDEIMEAGSTEPFILPVDFLGATPNDLHGVVDSISKEFDAIHGLFNNAAILGHLAPVSHQSLEQWYNLMQINLNAPFMLTQACLGLLNNAPKAHIMFTTDSVATEPKAYWAPYAASKAALETFAHTLREELSEHTNIQVHCIDPGPCQTAMRKRAYPAESIENLPTPDEVVEKFVGVLS